MWYLEKDIKISAAHHLEGYSGKCQNLHGHSWLITVYCKGNKLDKNGILVDFVTIKNALSRFDHADLNALMPSYINPTAENLAERFLKLVPLCYKVMVQEEEGSRCYYVKGE